MHPSRLSFLAGKHKQRRAVVSRDVRTDGTHIVLECGHTTKFVPHCDVSGVTDCGCSECGEQYVRTAPQYAKEFENA
jgi:uncharacterized pyridoxal phosphate-containing UPF0001 family protein